MLQRVKESSIASAMRASNVRIVDLAEPPALPYKPSLPMNSALGLLSGLFVGVVFVIMRERADCSLQNPGDAQFWLNVPELGVIPSATKERSASPPLSLEQTQLPGKASDVIPDPGSGKRHPIQRRHSGRLRHGLQRRR